jgi:pretoxin HINT domain-containing protein
MKAVRRRALLLRLLGPFRGSAAGHSLVEYLIIVGACALVGVVGFSRYGQAIKKDLGANAKHIEGEGLPQTEGILGALGADYNEVPGWCVKPNYCFGPGTPVHTERGDRAIETIRVGDRIWARDVTTGAIALRAVVNTYQTPGVTVIDLDLLSHFGRVERLAVTRSHLFWVEGAGWVRADALSEQPLWSVENLLSAEMISDEQRSTTVYNLEVADFHSYFVGHEHVLVHNGDPNSSACPEASTPSAPSKSKKPKKINTNRAITCGEFGSYRMALGGGREAASEEKNRPSGTMERDHVPSRKAQYYRAQKLMEDMKEQMMAYKCRPLTDDEQQQLEDAAQKALKMLDVAVQEEGFSIVEPKTLHQNTRTHTQTQAQAQADAQDLADATRKDVAKIRQLLKDPAYKRNLQNGCADKIEAALKLIENTSNEEYDKELEGVAQRLLLSTGYSKIIEGSCDEPASTAD